MNVIPLRTAPVTPIAATETAAGPAAAPVHLLGTLAARLPDGQFAVDDEAGVRWTCRRAASCLLRPEVGDTVMLSGPDRARVYLIAVIEQADASTSRVEAPGHLTLAAGNGAVAIESAQDLHLRSAGTLRMRGAQWALKAAQGDCQVERMRYTGQAVDATVGRMRLLGKMFETLADRVVLMARSTFRLVDETEQVRAGHLDCEATDTVRIHGHHTVVTGKALVKVDAAQIHVG